MPRPRSMFPGGTDYTGVDLQEMLAHLTEWRDGLADTTAALGNIRVRLAARGSSPEVRDGLEFIDYFRDLFTRYQDDLKRLLVELPSGVLPRHVAIARQLYESSRLEEDYCVSFKRRHLLDMLPDDYERVEHTLADIYARARDEVINLRDLSNVVRRLETYVGQGPATPPASGTALTALELKPNLFGVGLNLNYILERWGPRKWWDARRRR